MIGRPRTTDRKLTILQLLGGCVVSVLIFFYRLGIDEVGNVDQHAFRIHLLAADLLFEGIEQLVYLHRDGPRLGLTLAVPRCLDPQLGEVFASHSIGKLRVRHGLAQGTIPNHQFQVHLRLAPQPLHALTEGPPVGADCLPQSILAVKHSPKPERQDRALPETHAYHPRMLQYRLLIQITRLFVLTDDHRKLPAGISHHGSSIYSLYTFKQKRPPGTTTVCEGL